MTKENIRDWLDTIGQDRFWLASQLGSTKGTLDQWFSRGFPEWAEKAIKRIAAQQSSADSDPNSVQFTIAEFEMIDRARRKVGYETRREFYRDAIIEYADKLLVDDEDADTPCPLRAAEEPPPDHGFRKKKPPGK